MALTAIFLDPTQPTRLAMATYVLLAVYVAWSGLLAALASLRHLGRRGAVAVHVADICVFVTLVYLTEGPTSPLFVFFTFGIVSAGLHWGARGVALTAAVLLLSFLLSTSLAGPGADLNRVIVRSAYLIVAAVLIGYFGWHRERTAQQLQRLAEWPATATPQGDDPPIEQSLRHAALVMGVESIDMVWRERRSNLWYIAELRGETCSIETWPARSPPVEASPPSAGPSLSDALLQRIGAKHRVLAAFEGARAEGAVLVPHAVSRGSDLERFVAIAARRLGLELEHHYLRDELASAAISRERQRLSRDMHDGVLQDLAAVGLHLEAISRLLPEDRRETIRKLGDMVRDQQARIRSFVAEMNPGMRRSKLVALLPRLERTAQSLSQQWNVAVTSRVTPPDAEIAETDEVHLHSLIGEATANSVRHGAATSVRVEVAIGDSISLEIADNGRPQKSGVVATQALPTPLSLKQRVSDLGGTYSATMSDAGVSIRVTLPMRA
ncbi:MAG TPA: histidine kinase [Devosia sp.]